MATDDDTRKLLEEIRDAERDHLTEYRRVTQLSLDLQKQAVLRQEQMAGLYRRVLAFGGLMVLALLILLVALLVRWAPRLFG